MKNLFKSASCGNSAKKFIYMGEVMGENENISNETVALDYDDVSDLKKSPAPVDGVDTDVDEDFMAQIESQEGEPPYKDALMKVLFAMSKSMFDNDTKKIGERKFERTVTSINLQYKEVVTYEVKKDMSSSINILINDQISYEFEIDEEDNVSSAKKFIDGKEAEFNKDGMRNFLWQVGVSLENNFK